MFCKLKFISYTIIYKPIYIYKPRKWLNMVNYVYTLKLWAILQEAVIFRNVHKINSAFKHFHPLVPSSSSRKTIWKGFGGQMCSAQVEACIAACHCWSSLWAVFLGPGWSHRTGCEGKKKSQPVSSQGRAVCVLSSEGWGWGAGRLVLGDSWGEEGAACAGALVCSLGNWVGRPSN